MRKSASHLLENILDYFWCFVTFVIWSLEETLRVNSDMGCLVSSARLHARRTLTLRSGETSCLAPGFVKACWIKCILLMKRVCIFKSDNKTYNKNHVVSSGGLF